MVEMDGREGKENEKNKHETIIRQSRVQRQPKN